MTDVSNEFNRFNQYVDFRNIKSKSWQAISYGMQFAFSKKKRVICNQELNFIFIIYIEDWNLPGHVTLNTVKMMGYFHHSLPCYKYTIQITHNRLNVLFPIKILCAYKSPVSFSLTCTCILKSKLLSNKRAIPIEENELKSA